MINVPIYSQRDSRWHTIPLGTGSLDIGSVGCLLTCMSMLCTYYGHYDTPETLNKKLIAKNGYVSGNLYKWYEGVPKIYPDITCTGLFPVPDPLSAGQEIIIDKELEAGRPVICEVDYDPYTAVVDMHWVVIVDKKDGTYIINDPWDGKQKLITHYGNQKKTIQYFVTHNGKVPIVDNTMNTELQKIYKATNTKTADELIDVWHTQMGYLEQERKEKAELEADCIAFERQLTDVEATNASLEQENDKLVHLNRENEAKIISLTAQATEWDATSKAYNVNSFTHLDAIVRALKDELAIIQNSNIQPEVLKQCKLDLSNARKESVKTVSKTTLIKELINRLIKKAGDSQ